MEKLFLATQDDLTYLIEQAVEKAFLKSNGLNGDQNILPELLSISQASTYLNLAKQTLYGFTSKGEIPFFKKGKKLYFRKSDLNKWLRLDYNVDLK